MKLADYLFALFACLLASILFITLAGRQAQAAEYPDGEVARALSAKVLLDRARWQFVLEQRALLEERGIGRAVLVFSDPSLIAGVPPPPPEPPSVPEMIVERWKGEDRQAAATALSVAYWESKWLPEAANPTCCASGLFQITQRTWINHCGNRADFRARRFLPEDNIECAFIIWQERGWWPWSVWNEDVEPGPQVKVCLEDPFCRMSGEVRAVAEQALL